MSLRTERKKSKREKRGKREEKRWEGEETEGDGEGGRGEWKDIVQNSTKVRLEKGQSRTPLKILLEHLHQMF